MATIPIGLLLIFLLAILVLGICLYVIITGSVNAEFRAKLPAWSQPVAYAFTTLLIPFVALITTMFIFPCWWQACPDDQPGHKIEAQEESRQGPGFQPYEPD